MGTTGGARFQDRLPRVGIIAGDPSGIGPEVADARRPVAVVVGSLLGVLERVVGRLDLFEPGLGGRIVGVAIGVVLLGEAAVGAFDLIGGRVALHAQDFVVVGLGHAPPWGPKQGHGLRGAGRRLVVGPSLRVSSQV